MLVSRALPCVTRPSILSAAGCLLLFLLFTRLSDVYPPETWPVSVTQMTVGVMVLLLLARRFTVDGGGFVWDRSIGWMLVYGVWIVLSALAAGGRVTPVSDATAFFREAIIVFVIVNALTTPGNLRLANWSLIAAGVLLATAGMVGGVTGYGFGGLSTTTIYQGTAATSHVRLEGPVGLDSNYFAEFMLTTAVLALYCAWDERRMALRLAAMGATSLMLTAIVWTFSRGATVALVVVLMAAGIMQRLKPRRLAVLAIVLVPVLLATPSIYWSRLARTAQWRPTNATIAARSTSTPGVPLPDHKSLNDRWRLWQIGWHMLMDHPLVGVGKGNYYEVYPRYAANLGPRVPVGPHVGPVHIAAETGVVGLALFAVVVLVAISGVRQAKRRWSREGQMSDAIVSEAVEVAIYAYLVTSMFLNHNIYERYLWLLVGLAAAAHRVAMVRPGFPAAPIAPAQPARRS